MWSRLDALHVGDALTAGGQFALTDCYGFEQPWKRTDESFFPAFSFHLKHKKGSKRSEVKQFTTCATLLSKVYLVINCSETSQRGG